MRRASLHVAVASLAMVAVACAGTDESVAPVAKSAARPGGTITIAIGRPASIDPAHVAERWGRLVASLVCDPLIALDPRTGEPLPGLARSWNVGSSGRRITVKLRKDLRFHDGSDVTADDVVFALTRIASEEEGSNLAEALRPIAGWETLHGDREPRNEEEATSLIGVRTVGTDAVQIALTEPRADFLRLLAQEFATPQPRGVVSRDPIAFERKPVCTGPYALVRPWQPDDREIELVRFDGYHGAHAGFTRGGRGYADRIVLRVVGADEPVEADVVLHGRATAHDARTVVAPLPYLEHIAMPTTVTPFDRRDVRLALSRALDRAAIAREVYDGERFPAHGFLPPAMAPFAAKDGCGTAAPARADVAAARRALAEAGITLQGRIIPVYYNPDFRNRALAETVARQWNAAFGSRARPVRVRWPEYLDRAQSRNGFYGPFRMGWEPRYLGPDPMLAPLFASGSIGRDNVTGFDDPRFDRALERDARRAGSEDDLRRHYRRLEAILCEQMPAIPIAFGGAPAAVDLGRVDSAVDSFVGLTGGTVLVRELFVRAQP